MVNNLLRLSNYTYTSFWAWYNLFLESIVYASYIPCTFVSINQKLPYIFELYLYLQHKCVAQGYVLYIVDLSTTIHCSDRAFLNTEYAKFRLAYSVVRTGKIDDSGAQTAEDKGTRWRSLGGIHSGILGCPKSPQVTSRCILGKWGRLLSGTVTLGLMPSHESTSTQVQAPTKI